MQRQEDWHAYLGLSPQAPEEQIAQAVERLSRQAAALAVTAPERSQRLRDTIRLIKRDLLSGQENRQRYDLGLAGWTCPACGKEALPGDRFCTKCGTPHSAGPARGGTGEGAPRMCQLRQCAHRE
jgi:hypothetical protein